MMWIAVIAGGALGSLARHVMNLAVLRLLGDTVPYATVAVNMIGSLVIGLLAGAMAAQRLTLSPTMRTFVFVGILGGFTTFSSFMLDSLTLLESGRPALTLANLAGQIGAGFLLVYLGFRLGLGSFPG